jgi:rRNA maturation endonuclease Nob1
MKTTCQKCHKIFPVDLNLLYRKAECPLCGKKNKLKQIDIIFDNAEERETIKESEKWLENHRKTVPWDIA